MTDTTNEAIAALCERLRGSPDSLSFIGAVNKAISTIEALAADRDAALARVELEHAARDMLRAEGARQERAAIVADLRKAPKVPRQYHDLADRYERGEHLEASHD